MSKETKARLANDSAATGGTLTAEMPSPSRQSRDSSPKGRAEEQTSVEEKRQKTVTLLKLLADETRLRILAVLSREDCYVELLAARLGLAPATVCYHLKKMEAAGLVRCSRSQFYIIYALEREVLACTLGDIVLGDSIQDPHAAAEEAAADEAYRQEVISHFFKYGRLLRFPAQQKKQIIVLREIASRFASDRAYTERELNAAILPIYEDFCTIRRALVTAGLMTRSPDERGENIYRLI